MGSSRSVSATLHIARRKLTVTNLQKVLYPSGFTKGEVLDYYVRVSPVMLKYLRDRAVTLKRYPSGTIGAAKFFFEKNCPPHRPDWVVTKTVPGANGPGPNHCLINDAAALVWAANLAALELHVTMARASAPDRPTAIVFDLDPGPPAGLAECLSLGLKLRDVLAALGLESFPKTSGGKGLHVYVPLNTGRATFADTKRFAHAVAMVFERENADRVTATMSKSVRGGKVFVDWSQNDNHKTTVCAYSLRARDEPTVSTPLTWDEVAAADAKGRAASLVFRAPDVLERTDKLGDLFEPITTLKQKLPQL
jgi:bifunctional non-homologous end joining protein LigD